MKTIIAILLTAACAHAQTNQFEILSIQPGAGQAMKCQVQSGRTVTNVLVSGLSKPLLAAWREYESNKASADRLRSYIASEDSRLRKLEDQHKDAGIPFAVTGSSRPRSARTDSEARGTKSGQQSQA